MTEQPAPNDRACRQLTDSTERDETVVLDQWPVKKNFYLTLDLECDYGTLTRSNTFHAVSAVPKLVEIVERHGVPLTCFLQTELLTEAPEAVQALEESSVTVEFHPHSHTHLRETETDTDFEVRHSATRVRDRFGTAPLGFRPPNGMVESYTYDRLQTNDIAFSAGLFPSIRPGLFNNLDEPIYPFHHERTGITEIPFTVFSDHIRIPVALSYSKLLGWPFQRLLSASPPPAIVFDFHMHDLVSPPVVENLPSLYRLAYSRRKNRGFEILEWFIQTFKNQGYTFGTMTELYDAICPRFE